MVNWAKRLIHHDILSFYWTDIMSLATQTPEGGSSVSHAVCLKESKCVSMRMWVSLRICCVYRPSKHISFHLECVIAASLPSLLLNIWPLLPLNAICYMLTYGLSWTSEFLDSHNSSFNDKPKNVIFPSIRLLVLLCTANECYLTSDMTGDLVYQRHRGWKETTHKDG